MWRSATLTDVSRSPGPPALPGMTCTTPSCGLAATPRPARSWAAPPPGHPTSTCGGVRRARSASGGAPGLKQHDARLSLAMPYWAGYHVGAHRQLLH